MRRKMLIVLLAAGAGIALPLGCKTTDDAHVSVVNEDTCSEYNMTAQNISAELERLIDELRSAHDDIESAIDDAENADLIEDNPWGKVEAFRDAVSDIKDRLSDIDTAITGLETQKDEIEKLSK